MTGVQPNLFEIEETSASVTCLRGQHAELVAGPVRDLGGCLNITFTCPRCQERVIEQSWNVKLMKPKDWQTLGLKPR